MTERENENPLSGVDAPRPLPDEVRTRLESELSELSATAVAVLPEGLDRPRPIPPATRARLESAVLAYVRSMRGRPAPTERQVRWYESSRSRQWMPVAAAAILLVVAVAGALTLNPPNGRDGFGRPDLLQGAGGSGGTRLGETTTTLSPGQIGPAPPFSDRGTTADALAAAPPAAANDFSTSSGAEAASGAGRSSADQATAGPIRVGLSGPDNAVASGFRAYMNTVNGQGGIGGSRRVESVNPSSPGLIATVSTSLAGPLDPRSSAPRLEGPAAEEGRLRGDTFSFASAPERLGHLLADALYPQPKAGAQVAIFTGTGVYDQIVPAALESALREKGVVSGRVATRSGRPTAWPSAEVAVLSMHAEDARSWLSAAAAEGYRPTRFVAGFWGLLDPSVTRELPEGSVVITSYATPRQAEADAMTAAAGGPPSFGFVHGWATAKALALALWQSGASTPEQLTHALSSFPRDDLGGLIAPYAVRGGTNSRTPEGLVLQLQKGTLVPQGGFRADPRT